MKSFAARFPDATLPRTARIAALPTPLERFEIDTNADVWVKRDDLTSARYGGNKVRKLDLLLGEALGSHRKSVLTFGAYGSNHALATAVHARALGMTPHAVLSPQEPGPFAPATLLAHAGLGTVIHLVDGWDGRREAVLALREIAEADGVDPSVIPMGGTNELGALGYVNAALEILEQSDEAPDVVYVAGGTLGTAIGLAAGFALAGEATRVETIRVTPESVGSENIAAEVGAALAHHLHKMGGGLPYLALADLNYELRHDWFEPGYGVVTPETTRAVAVAKEAGIKLETTYTGKALAALMADAKAGKLAGKRVVFIDTYNSAPMPTPGPIEALPETLQDYIAQCRAMYREGTL
ncbi:MAG TPA: pyridoxal-phosphate dependent enzyme [Coriobacteriia bacterium]|nr:pyridoxal-phosphate dependent enzyme [Coriobacteriia bacterium]